jgi:hypothetical protein
MKIIADRRRNREFRLQNASVNGEGLQAGVKNASWREILEMAYEGRGGYLFKRVLR